MLIRKVCFAVCWCHVGVILVTLSAVVAAPLIFNSNPDGIPGLAVSERGNRLTTVEWESYHEHEHEGPGTYAFGYDIQNKDNVQFREESRDANGTVRGSYGLIEPDGNIRVVHYIADERGFRVEIENTLRPDEQWPAKHKAKYFSPQQNSLRS